MTSITIRVSEELRKKMRNFSMINWSEVARRAIESRVAQEMAREEKYRGDISEAGKKIDGIYEKLRAEHGTIPFDSSATIREWRDRRYAASS